MNRPRPNLQEVRFELMNKWQDKCFCKSHDEKSIDCERLLVPQHLIKTTTGIFRCDRRRRTWFLDGMSGLAGTILVSMFLLTSAFAQEQQKHAYSEFSFANYRLWENIQRLDFQLAHLLKPAGLAHKQGIP